ncbi:MAG: TM2 domain-containing protein [Rikenellaceae bacterium]
MFCKNCGKELSDNAISCPQCGEPTAKPSVIPSNASDREWLPTLLLCFFLGSFGVHSFYVGKTGIGVIQLLTLGCCGMWSLIDFIMIVTNSYKDSEGRLVVR